MTPLAALINDGRIEAGSAYYAARDDWMQGRTIYGGLSAAFCLAGTHAVFPGLPPLRAAQIAFIGPAGGEVEVRPKILRQGRSATFVAADLLRGDDLATRALFVFGAERPTALQHADFPMPDVAAPDDCIPFPASGLRPSFLTHFDVRVGFGGLPFCGNGEGDIGYWFRHHDDAQLAPGVRLVALADALVPAITPKLTEIAPVGTLSWQFDILDMDADATSWHFNRATTEFARDGYAAQTMGIWREDGTAVLAGRQQVAIFGEGR